MTLVRDSSHLEIYRTDREARYADNWVQVYKGLFADLLVPGVRILDIGSGRTPAIKPTERPEGCHYVGLDISATELALAPEGSYDEIVVRDLNEFDAALEDSFDLVVSWQVLEHVSPLVRAVENTRRYLVDGGTFVAMLAGGNAFFSVLNRIVPERLGKIAMEKLLRRQPDTVFRAHYDSCTYDGLANVFCNWTKSDIIPRYRGAGYLGFSAPVARVYLVYEDWAATSQKNNLATHYVVIATK